MSALIALILQAAAPDAAAAANAADLRCLAAIASGGSDAASRSLVAAGSMYFLGRIDARSPGFDYQGEMLKLVRSGATLEADRARCLAELRSRGGALVNLSQGLRAHAGK